MLVIRRRGIRLRGIYTVHKDSDGEMVTGDKWLRMNPPPPPAHLCLRSGSQKIPQLSTYHNSVRAALQECPVGFLYVCWLYGAQGTSNPRPQIGWRLETMEQTSRPWKRLLKTMEQTSRDHETDWYGPWNKHIEPMKQRYRTMEQISEEKPWKRRLGTTEQSFYGHGSVFLRSWN